MNEDRRGIDRLRAAIDDVATGIENRQPSASRSPRARSFALVLGGAAALVALLVATVLLRSPGAPDTSEVEVLVLRVHGRDVSARIMDDVAPATIIVMPQPEAGTPPAAAGMVFGGTR